MNQIKGITIVDENGGEEIIPNIFYWRIYSDDSKLIEGVNYMDLPIKIIKSYITEIYGNLAYFCDVLPLDEIPEWFSCSSVFSDEYNIEIYQMDISLLYTNKDDINPLHQVVKMSTDEKKAMYRKVRKEKLIEMLISANDNLDLITQPIEVYLKSEKIRPSLPPFPPNRLISNTGKKIEVESDNEPNYGLIGAAVFGCGSIFGMIMFYLIMLISTK